MTKEKSKGDDKDWKYWLGRSALATIRAGRLHDGVAMLEREFFPKYGSAVECRAKYNEVMGAPV